MSSEDQLKSPQVFEEEEKSQGADMSIIALIKKTFPFILARILIYGAFGIAAFIFLGIMVGIGFLLIRLFGEASVAFLILMLISFGVVYAGLKFLERYVLYLVKLGHVSVIVELMRKGKVPEGKGMVAYGKDQVTDNFGSSNVAFLLDTMVHGAVRQIQRWMLRVGNFFNFIPGAKNIIGILNMVMSVSLSYIDEAIMSYIFLRKSEKRDETVWKSASDGVVLYAQSWKGIIKAAAGSVIFIYLFNIILFLSFVFPFMIIGSMIGSGTPGLGTLLGFLALVAAYISTTLLRRALIDPIVTIVMIRSYQMSIRSLEPAMDLQQKLLSVSSRFKKLFQKSKEEEDKVEPAN